MKKTEKTMEKGKDLFFTGIWGLGERLRVDFCWHLTNGTNPAILKEISFSAASWQADSLSIQEGTSAPSEDFCWHLTNGTNPAILKKERVLPADG